MDLPMKFAKAQRQHTALIKKITSGRSTPADVQELKLVATELLDLADQMAQAMRTLNSLAHRAKGAQTK